MRLSPSIVILRTQSDERLVQFARAGSEPAFAAIVERYGPDILRACARVLPAARAEDASQQTFIAAWTALQRGDAVTGLRPWLITIARNTALNALRVAGYDYVELRDSLGIGEAPQSELERRDVVRQTLAGVAALPERQREVLLRSAVQGVSYADIARDMGLSDGATRQLVMRARATLRAAASALIPTPLIARAAAGHGGSGGSANLIERLGDLLPQASGAAAGGGAWAAKAAVIAVVAGSAAVAPSVVHHRTEPADASPGAPAHQARRLVERRPTAGTASRAVGQRNETMQDGSRAAATPTGVRPSDHGPGAHARPSRTQREAFGVSPGSSTDDSPTSSNDDAATPTDVSAAGNVSNDSPPAEGGPRPDGSSDSEISGDTARDSHADATDSTG